MEFKLINKTNVGTVATLFLIIVLSNSRIFDFLIDTTLGRAILILFILGISYTNKILGVVTVLFIIIFFNNSDIGYLEGFSNSPNIKENVVEENVNENVVEENVKENDVNENVDLNVIEKNSNTPSIEGFNIIEREHMILKGKRSNEVPIYSNARNQDDVEPTDKSVFVSNYSSV
jgi:hypothetical protein